MPLPTEPPDPNHPILADAWDYRIVGLCFYRTLDGSEESYLDLTVQKGAVVRRLRFFNPQDIRIEEGFPQSCGLSVIDVRARGMEGVRVQVTDFEAHGGGVRFWARDVTDLDKTDHRLT